MAEWHHFSVNRALDTDMEYEQGGNLWVDRFAKPKGQGARNARTNISTRWPSARACAYSATSLRSTRSA